MPQQDCHSRRADQGPSAHHPHALDPSGGVCGKRRHHLPTEEGRRGHHCAHRGDDSRHPDCRDIEFTRRKAGVPITKGLADTNIIVAGASPDAGCAQADPGSARAITTPANAFGKVRRITTYTLITGAASRPSRSAPAPVLPDSTWSGGGRLRRRARTWVHRSRRAGDGTPWCSGIGPIPGTKVPATPEHRLARADQPQITCPGVRVPNRASCQCRCPAASPRL